MVNNIFQHIPNKLPHELFESLLENANVKIERIVSRGHATSTGEWYDQAWDEWVLLLQGQALLTFADGENLSLQPGDYLLIPAHRRHRVTWTAPDTDTVWLAVHIHPR